MAKIAILYGTTEGQTAKIAQRLAALGREHGHDVEYTDWGEVVRFGETFFKRVQVTVP